MIGDPPHVDHPFRRMAPLAGPGARSSTVQLYPVHPGVHTHDELGVKASLPASRCLVQWPLPQHANGSLDTQGEPPRGIALSSAVVHP